MLHVTDSQGVRLWFSPSAVIAIESCSQSQQCDLVLTGGVRRRIKMKPEELAEKVQSAALQEHADRRPPGAPSVRAPKSAGAQAP